ncbi:MAG: peptidyl-prolyl cis-trans isomerase [Holosporaceae bacterium]|nr:peptidyl-prolyl cis-trans isomerase [Holosporaceae bacterium]
MNNKTIAIIGGGLLLSSAFAENGVNNNDRYVEIHAKHILVETETQANKILQDIQDGKLSFEEAAKKQSSCPSRTNGGDLGYFGRGAMIKEFEKVAFATPKGEISKPVKTQFGWHIIKVIDKKK